MIFGLVMGTTATNAQPGDIKKKEKKPIPPKGYNVTFECNASSANLTVDGKRKGSANGTYYLTTGKHSVKLNAFGYVSLSKTITVDSSHKYYYLYMDRVEKDGYDVYFSCNVPSALMSIDGVASGTASGSRFLKKGSHSIQLTANGYETLTRSIVVNSENSRYSFTMEKRQESPQQAILKNLVSNMVYVEGGTFMMGATKEQGKDAYDDEKPYHQVTLSSFSIGKFEVTQEEWEAVMGSNPSKYKGAKLPVECVSWEDCQTFIEKLNALTGKSFRLPTEAEWEYAARGGNRSRGYKYASAGDNTLGNVAWYNANSGGKTHEVGKKQPNELGLYDMSGNVWEWCHDKYGKYSSLAQTNSTGSGRVLRGGSWGSDAGRCRVSYRRGSSPSCRNNYLGLRLAL